MLLLRVFIWVGLMNINLFYFKLCVIFSFVFMNVYVIELGVYDFLLVFCVDVDIFLW